MPVRKLEPGSTLGMRNFAVAHKCIGVGFVKSTLDEGASRNVRLRLLRLFQSLSAAKSIMAQISLSSLSEGATNNATTWIFMSVAALCQIVSFGRAIW